jgi:hypothetical protein
VPRVRANAESPCRPSSSRAAGGTRRKRCKVAVPDEHWLDSRGARTRNGQGATIEVALIPPSRVLIRNSQNATRVSRQPCVAKVTAFVWRQLKNCLSIRSHRTMRRIVPSKIFDPGVLQARIPSLALTRTRLAATIERARQVLANGCIAPSRQTVCGREPPGLASCGTPNVDYARQRSDNSNARPRLYITIVAFGPRNARSTAARASHPSRQGGRHSYTSTT